MQIQVSCAVRILKEKMQIQVSCDVRILKEKMQIQVSCDVSILKEKIQRSCAQLSETLSVPRHHGATIEGIRHFRLEHFRLQNIGLTEHSSEETFV